jgi:uncharacterized membrane protein
VALSIFLAAMAMNYSAGFGLAFVILSYTVGFLSFIVQERIWNIVSWGKIGSHDTKTRSVVKTVTWRLWSMLVLFVVAMVMGLKSQDAAEWSIVTNILFVVVHYTHERVWNRITWGRTQVEVTEEAAI